MIIIVVTMIMITKAITLIIVTKILIRINE